MKTVSTSTKHRFEIILYYIAAFLIPSIPLFHLYNQNRVENDIALNHVLIFGLGVGIAGLMIFIALRAIVKSVEGALLISIVGWSAFWLYGEMWRAVSGHFQQRVFMLIILAFLVIIVFVFWWFKPPFVLWRPVFNVLAIATAVMFVVNLVPGVNHEILLRSGRMENSDAEEAPLFKRDFFIDESLPSPDIHWFHMDGMISLFTFESFYGYDQEHLREELSLRGFLINENATLNIPSTRGAMPALLSPAFYDNYYGERLLEIENMLNRYAYVALTDRLAEDGLTLQHGDDILTYLELPSALFATGYEIVHVRGRNPLSSTIRNLSGSRTFWGLQELGDLPELLTLVTPLNLTARGRSNRAIPSSNPRARFIWHSFMHSHVHYWFQIDPNQTGRDDLNDPYRIYDWYPLAFEYGASSMLDQIDAILEENPNAVIILQSDHGFSNYRTHRFLVNQGYSLDRIFELIYSTFSAVRIPEIYGGLEVPLDPKNISRELVNRFVGQNYELLPQ